MIEVGILKNFDSGTYKAGVQLAGSLTTYFDDISVAKNIASGAMVIGNYVILAIPGGNPRDACVIATWPGGSSGGGMEVHGNEYHSPAFWHGGLTDIIDKTHLSQDFGASGNRLHTWIFTPKQGKACGVQHCASSPFSGKINGNPTATEVVYDGESNENCLKGIETGADKWGRFVLHNTTRGNSRLITDFDETIKKIYTESSTDDWADDDDVTLQSQICDRPGMMDLDLSDEVGSDEIEAFITIDAVDKSAGAQPSRRIIAHPYEAFDYGKRVFCNLYLSDEKTTMPGFISINGQKMCLRFDNCSDVGFSLYFSATLEYADT
jgi:hypothetical protein